MPDSNYAVVGPELEQRFSWEMGVLDKPSRPDLPFTEDFAALRAERDLIRTSIT